MTVFPRDLVPLLNFIVCLSLFSLYRQNHVLPKERVPAHLKPGFDYHRVIKCLQFFSRVVEPNVLYGLFQIVVRPSNIFTASFLFFIITGMDFVLVFMCYGQGFRSRG
jgi:hypothetical protein